MAASLFDPNGNSKMVMLKRLALPKIRDGLGQLPEWVVESPVALGSAVNPYWLCAESRRWILCVLSGRISTVANYRLKKNEELNEAAPPRLRRVNGMFVHHAA
jgi:hypothetical protein